MSNGDAGDIRDGAAATQPARDGRRPRGDVRAAAVTNGAPAGTSGWPAWAIGYAIILVATILFATVNVFSVLDERSWMERPLDPWEPIVWEGSSGIALLSLAWVPLLMIRRFPLAGPRRLPNLALHVLATIAFSLTHVGMMVAMRHLAYALAGETYTFGWVDALVYEYRKDVTSYAIYAGTFWLTARLMHVPAAPAVIVPQPVSDIVIDEGQRVLRMPPREVLCVRSSGNYAEFFLADGRRPLMRATLASLEEALADAGFVRTHRSWLVNPAHVVEIAAEGSGDYGLKLTGGDEVPLSRRYPEALAQVRGQTA